MTVNKYENLAPYTFVTSHLITDMEPNAMPMVCVKSGNPKEGAWVPIPLTESTNLPENENLYICISSCRRLFDPSSNKHNTYRATIECASQTHMFMLDDLGDGTTDTPDWKDLPITPSWVIETSPHNYQCLYVLVTPLRDIALAQRIAKALPASANSDPSAINAVRWARLPGGINSKPDYLDADGKGFAVRIADSNPDIKYHPQDLIAAFQLDIDVNAVAPSTQNNAPIIKGTEPVGWNRYLAALLAIPPECEYGTWFNCLIAMHAWGEAGLIACQEWSSSSTEASHSDMTFEKLAAKWDTIEYDSRNTKGRDSVVSWPWLQAEAQRNGWSYEEYSKTQLEELRTTLTACTTENAIQDTIKDIQDSFLCAGDLEQLTSAVQGAFKVLGVPHTVPIVRRLLTQSPTLDSNDETWTFPLTDQGNLERFCFIHKDEFYFIPETRQYLHWENNRWNYIREIQHLVISTIEEIPNLENRVLTAAQEKQLQKWKHACGSSGHIRALESLCNKHLSFSKEISDLNTHKTIIGTPTSICNLDTGISSLNTPDHLITMHTGTDIVPDALCPRWDKFMLEVMNGDKEMARFMQKLAGYGLYGGNPEQLFIILEGHGANGKTTFVNVLQHIFGNYAATATADTLTRPAFNKSGSAAAPDIVRLYRKRLVICNEWNEGTYINEALIKVLAGGGDEISVRALYSNVTIDYVPEFLIMLATNHRPNITGMDYGIWRRLLIIPFEVNFTDPQHLSSRDPHLEDFLKNNEAEGIMNWLVEGYAMWRKEGMGSSVETGVPQKLITIKDKYKQDMDTVGQFLQECTMNIMDNTVADCIDFKIQSSELYKAYKNWSDENGYKCKGTKSFSQQLIHRGFPAARIGTTRGFSGVRLLTPSEILSAIPKTLGGEQSTTSKQLN